MAKVKKKKSCHAKTQKRELILRNGFRQRYSSSKTCKTDYHFKNINLDAVSFALKWIENIINFFGKLHISH